MKLLEIPLVLAAPAVAAANRFRRRRPFDSPGRRRLVIYGFVILVSCVVFWNLVAQRAGR